MIPLAMIGIVCLGGYIIYDESVEAGLGHGYTLRDPTYEEAVTFLRQDKTNENKHVHDTYACVHFARDVCNNAEKEGLRCAFVELRYAKIAHHSIIAFETIDKGLVYFEPQNDARVKPLVGERYNPWGEIRPCDSPEQYWWSSSIIMDILVIW